MSTSTCRQLPSAFLYDCSFSTAVLGYFNLFKEGKTAVPFTTPRHIPLAGCGVWEELNPDIPLTPGDTTSLISSMERPTFVDYTLEK